MAKRSRGKLDYNKMIKAGIGTGTGKEYEPPIKTQSFPSYGRTSRYN